MTGIKFNLTEKKFLVLLIVLAVVIATGMVLLINTSVRTKITTKIEETEAKFCDGYDWQAIDSLFVGDAEKEQIREALLKLTIEGSSLSGTPVVRTYSTYQEYKLYLNKFYSMPENTKLPIFFALKMFDMAKADLPGASIDIYKMAVLQKLKSNNLIK